MQSSTLKQLSILMVTVFVDMVGFTMVLPLLPFYATELGARPWHVGALVATYAFAALVTSPLWGRTSDRAGRRPMILTGLLASGAAYVLFGLANSLWLLFASRMVQGAGSGGITGVVQAYVADSVPPEERAQALGWVTAATSAGVMLGPAIGSFAAAFSREAPGFVAAGLCLLNFLFALKWLPEPPAQEKSGKPPTRLRRAFLQVLSHPLGPVSAPIWLYAIGMLAFMGMNGVLALYLKDAFGVTKETIGYFFVYVGGVGLIMRALLLGPSVRRFGELGVVRLGALSLMVGMACMPIPGALDAALPVRFALLAVIVLLVPVGTALLFPATTALVSRRSIRSEVGQTLGVQQSFGGVSRLIGPLAAGALYEIGWGFPFWIAGALMLCGTFLTLRLREEQAPEPVVAVEAPGQ
ncbi:MAG TPA: MFS transporter [Thermoanaerobaculia bacterium]